jgi:hypothetical protein
LHVTASYAGKNIFDISPVTKFPGSDSTTPVRVNSGEQLSGSYRITLSRYWNLKVRTTIKNLPEGMTVDTTKGCGKSPDLNPGSSCLLTLNYTVPNVNKDTIVSGGPIVCNYLSTNCTETSPNNQFNMSIKFLPKPSVIIKGIQAGVYGIQGVNSLLNNNSTLNNWFNINLAQDYNDIAFGNNKWVIAGGVSQDNKTTILTSDGDGNWKQILNNNSDVLFRILFANQQWMIGGANGVLYFSNDATKFTRIKLPTGNSVFGIEYVPAINNNSAYWIVITGDGTNYQGGEIFTSKNGVNWTKRYSIDYPYSLISIATNPNGRVLALARKEQWWEDAKLVTSNDGIKFTTTDYPYPTEGTDLIEQHFWRQALWNSLDNKWLIIGAHWTQDSANNWTYGRLGIESTDNTGTAYNQIPLLSDNSVSNFSDQNNAVRIKGSTVIVTNSNGYTYTKKSAGNWQQNLVKQNSQVTSPAFGRIEGTESIVSLVGGTQLFYATQSAPNSWSVLPNFEVTENSQASIASNSNGMWHSVGLDNTIIQSSNGVNWQLNSARGRLESIPSVGDIYRANDINQWLLIKERPTNNFAISYSSDGIAWTKANLTNIAFAGDYLWAAARSKEQKKYIVTGYKFSENIAEPMVLSSVNGKSWQRINTNGIPNSSSALRGIMWNAKISKWIAVGNQTIVSSSDATTWTTATDTSANNFNTAFLRSIVYGNDQFLALGKINNNQEVIYSSADGVNWTPNALNDPSGNGYWLRKAAWSNTKKLWVAVGFGGTIITSPDGINWTYRIWDANQSDWDFWDIQWSSTFNCWIAIGGSAVSQLAGNIILYSTNGRTWTRSTSRIPFLTSSIAIAE